MNRVEAGGNNFNSYLEPFNRRFFNDLGYILEVRKTANKTYSLFELWKIYPHGKNELLELGCAKTKEQMSE
jgi:hypothetical protein